MENDELKKALVVAEYYCLAHPENKQLQQVEAQLQALKKKLQKSFFNDVLLYQTLLSQLQVDLVAATRSYIGSHSLDSDLTIWFGSNIYAAAKTIDRLYQQITHDKDQPINYASSTIEYFPHQDDNEPLTGWQQETEDNTPRGGNTSFPGIDVFNKHWGNSSGNDLSGNSNNNRGGRDDHAPIIFHNKKSNTPARGSGSDTYVDLSEFFKTKADQIISPEISPVFEPKPSPPKKGKILYDIPGIMKLNKQQKCIVRIAKDELVVTDGDSFSDALKIEDIYLSRIMKVELIDIAEPPHFNIKTISSAEQSVDDDTYTEWLFWVTPLITGTCELILKVSGFKKIDGKEIRKDILFEKTINISAEEGTVVPGNATQPFENLAHQKNVSLVDPPSVFISYAHKDKIYFDIFYEHLLSHSGWTIWIDKNIEIGGDWFNRIQSSIQISDFAILLVSADFISSAFIKDHEYSAFLELEQSKKGFAFLPVLLRDVDFNRWEALATHQFFVAYGDEYGLPLETGKMIAFAKLCRFDNNGSLIPNDNIDTYFKNLVRKVENDWLRHI